MTDWDALEQSRELLQADSARQVVDAILGMHGRLSALEAALEGCMRERGELAIRQEALKAAREHVASMSSQQPNERGYRDGALKGADLVAQEIRVARYLLGQEE